MSEALGVKAYQAIFEGNGESLMVRMKGAEKDITVLQKQTEKWESIAVKLVIACGTTFLASIAQIAYHLLK